MPRGANSFSVLGDADTEPAPEKASTSRRRRRRGNKKAPASAVPGANAGEDAAAGVVAACVKAGFTAAQARAAMEAMWSRGADGVDDPDAVIAELKRPSQEAKATNGAAKAAAAPVVQAKSKRGRKKDAPAAAAEPAAAHEGASSAEGASEASRLETVAVLADLDRVIDAYTAWARSATDESMDTFMSCRALPLLFENILKQLPGPDFDDKLTGFLTKVVGVASKGAISSVAATRAVIDALSLCESSAPATAQSTARSSAADRIANAIRAFYAVSASSSGAEASRSSFESTVSSASAQLSKLARAQDTKSLFQKRDLHEELVGAFEERVSSLRGGGGASSVAVPSRPTGAQLGSGVSFDAAVGKLAPRVDAARAGRVRQRMDSIRAEEATALAPLSKEYASVDAKVSSLLARQEALAAELREVESALGAATAQRRSVEKRKAEASKSFAARLKALDAENAGVVATLQRSEAVMAAQAASRNIDTSLAGLTALASGAGGGLDAGSAGTTTRKQYIDAVAAYADTEAKCIQFIAGRVSSGRARHDTLSKELASYVELRMGETQVAANVRAEMEKTLQNVEEDQGTHTALTQCLRRLTSQMLEVVRAAARGGGSGVYAPLSETEATTLRRLRDDLATVGVPVELPGSISKLPSFDTGVAASLGLTALIPKSPAAQAAVPASQPPPLPTADAPPKPRAPKAAKAAPQRAARPVPAAVRKPTGAITAGTTAGGMPVTETSTKAPTFSWGKKAPAASTSAKSLAEIQAEELRAAKEVAASKTAPGAEEEKGSDATAAADASAAAPAADSGDSKPAKRVPQRPIDLPVSDDETWADLL